MHKLSVRPCSLWVIFWEFKPQSSRFYAQSLNPGQLYLGVLTPGYGVILASSWGIRFTKCYDGCKKLQVNSSIVQSPHSKKALGKILKDYPKVITRPEHPTFQAPFQPFVHRWTNLVRELAEALAGEQKSKSRTHLRLLYRILKEGLRDGLKAHDNLILNGVITYSNTYASSEDSFTYARKVKTPYQFLFETIAQRRERLLNVRLHNVKA